MNEDFYMVKVPKSKGKTKKQEGDFAPAATLILWQRVCSECKGLKGQQGPRKVRI